MSHIVSIAGTRLLAGMYWSRLQTGQRNRRGIKAGLKALASEYAQVFGESPHIGALHSTGIDLLMGVGEQPSTNAGLAKKDKSKTYSMACIALLANPGKRSFVGRVRLSEEYEWIVVARSGVISPIGDMVVETSKANTEFTTICERNSDLEILFDIRDAEKSQALLESWVTKSLLRKAPQVKELQHLGASSLSKKTISVYGAVGVVLLTSIYIGYSEYSSYIEEKKIREEAARQAAIDRLNSNSAIATPWKEWPSIEAVVSACLENHKMKATYKYGWEQTYWSCDGASVTQNWARTDVGSYAFLPTDGGFNLVNPNEISHTEKISDALMPRGKQPIAPKETVGKILMDAARLHGMAISVKWGEEASRTYTKEGKQKTEYLGYSRNTARITGKEISEIAIVSTLRKIPGLNIANISEERSEIAIKIEFFTAI